METRIVGCSCDPAGWQEEEHEDGCQRTLEVKVDVESGADLLNVWNEIPGTEWEVRMNSSDPTGVFYLRRKHASTQT